MGKTPSAQRVSWYDTKQSDDEVSVMLWLWWMLSTPLLPSLPGSLWPGVVAPDKILSMGQTELNCLLIIIIIIIIILSYRQHSYSWPSRHFSLSFISSGRSSGLHPVSSHSCCIYVRAGRPARPYVGVHRSTSLMSSFLLLQQCPACLVRLTWIVFVMGGRWPYSWCFVGCCLQDLVNIARNILV